MPYIARGKSGAIIAVFKQENECAGEFVSPEDRELQAFLGQNGPAKRHANKPPATPGFIRPCGSPMPISFASWTM